MLSQEECIYYLQKIKDGDENAKNILYENNMPLIKSIVKKFLNKGVEYNDLYQIACIGFTKAMNNFDITFNVKFSTYVVPMIIGEIKRFMRDNGAIKVSRAIKILANKMNHYIAEYETKNNKTPTIKELSEQFNVDEDQIVFALDSSKMPVSLFGILDSEDGDMELLDRLAIDTDIDNQLDKIELSKQLSDLTENEQTLIKIRYYKDMTQSETAKILGISQVQVSRIESKILKKLKSKLKCN